MKYLGVIPVISLLLFFFAGVTSLAAHCVVAAVVAASLLSESPRNAIGAALFGLLGVAFVKGGIDSHGLAHGLFEAGTVGLMLVSFEVLSGLLLKSGIIEKYLIPWALKGGRSWFLPRLFIVTSPFGIFCDAISATMAVRDTLKKAGLDPEKAPLPFYAAVHWGNYVSGPFFWAELTTLQAVMFHHVSPWIALVPIVGCAFSCAVMLVTLWVWSRRNPEIIEAAMAGLEVVETADSRPQGIDKGAVVSLFVTLVAMLSGKVIFTAAGPGATMIVGLIVSLLVFGHGAIGSRVVKAKNDLHHAVANSWATVTILAALFVAMSQSSAIEGVDPTSFGFWGVAALTSISAVAENNAFIGSLSGILRGDDELLQALVIFGVAAFGNLTLFGCVGSAISGLRMADFVRFLGVGLVWVGAGFAGMWTLGPAAIRAVNWIRNDAVARVSDAASFYWIEFQMRLGHLWTDALDALGLEPAIDAAHGLLIPAGNTDDNAAAI